MSDGIIVINAGSSSIKFSLYVGGNGSEPHLLNKGQIEGIGVAPTFTAKTPDGKGLADAKWDPHISHDDLFSHMLDWIEHHLDGAELKAAGHRVVHGGRHFSGPTLINEQVLTELDKLVPLAPLHQSHNLDPIRTLARLHPGLPQVACFDTSFHTTNDTLATMFAVPRWLSDEGVRRYGFHGLSYEYISHRLRSVDPSLAKGKVIVCHLGSGASMCAIENGHSVASTLGFTAVDGLPMGTRTGALDPGVVLYLLQEKNMDAKQIETLLYKQSGLLGISGISNDMRVLMQSSDPHAKEAVDYFIYRICREMGSLAASMGGVDGVIFTAGIGEHSPELRALVLEQCRWLGLGVDPSLNTNGEGRISPSLSKPVYVIPTDEELMIAMHTRRMLTQKAAAE
jgi:acetate kinase